MRKTTSIFILVLFILGISVVLTAKLCTHTSGSEQLFKQVLIPVIQKREISLNGGFRAFMGGKSRVNIPIKLPQHTKKWFYGFCATPGSNGTHQVNLLLQLSELLANSSGITKSTLANIKIPEGTHSLDVYLLDQDNVDSFMQKTPFHYLRQGTVENTKQAVVDIDDSQNNMYYLGLKNPSELDGLNVTIEVVALVEQKNE